jgi:hypothetical protein
MLPELMTIVTLFGSSAKAAPVMARTATTAKDRRITDVIVIILSPNRFLGRPASSGRGSPASTFA